MLLEDWRLVLKTVCYFISQTSLKDHNAPSVFENHGVSNNDIASILQVIFFHLNIDFNKYFLNVTVLGINDTALQKAKVQASWSLYSSETDQSNKC